MNRITSHWLTNSRTQRAMSMLGDAGYQAYCVGGCVRNDLLDQPVADIDISTNAHPETAIALAEQAGFKAIPTGIEHGTITVVIDGEPFEITTFRADVETDGRRAVVRFAETLGEDAIRRDFTMNALYLDKEGHVIDPVGGLDHLEQRRFVFIQDAGTRIREDYLRTLRYFRFMAWYGDPDQGFEADTLAAIAENLDGLSRLSRERIGSEIVKLLNAPNPAPAMAIMGQTGVLSKILPGTDVSKLALFDHIAGGMDQPVDPIVRLAVIGLQDASQLRLSKADQKKLSLVHGFIEHMTPIGEIAYDYGSVLAKHVLALRGALFEQMPNAQDLRIIVQAEQVRFPLTSQDLMPDWQGAALGQALRDGKRMWIASGFKHGAEELLNLLKKNTTKG